jgi:hypothetical protein
VIKESEEEVSTRKHLRSHKEANREKKKLKEIGTDEGECEERKKK